MTYPLPPRRRINPTYFEIGKDIGEGSLSTVHVATERATGKVFAIKVFNRQHLRSQHKDADVTMEEHCLRRLNHPGIVKLHSSFSDDVSRYLVIEHCPAGDLWELVKNAGCSDSFARHYLSQVLEALCYLREAGVVHRDVKAENVMISRSGNAKLIDFGTAKDLANPHIKGAGIKSFKKVLEDNVGTPNFMAPEAIKNKFTDFRSDTWSFGCMVFQLLTGLPPFGTNLLKIYDRAMKAKLEIPSGVSDVARDLIKRMVVVNPNARLGASDLRDVCLHPFFASLPQAASRFIGVSRLPCPVPSLEELCLRALGRRWDLFSERAAYLLEPSDESSLRREARSVLHRFKQQADIAAERARKRENGESSSSEKEGD